MQNEVIGWNILFIIYIFRVFLAIHSAKLVILKHRRVKTRKYITNYHTDLQPFVCGLHCNPVFWSNERKIENYLDKHGNKAYYIKDVLAYVKSTRVHVLAYVKAMLLISDN